eukprot:8470978-Karenia_brevis.AAC.1
MVAATPLAASTPGSRLPTTPQPIRPGIDDIEDGQVDDGVVPTDTAETICTSPTHTPESQRDGNITPNNDVGLCDDADSGAGSD